MKIKCVIIDDEYLAREYLKDYVSKVPSLELLGDFESPLLILDKIKRGEIDLLFMDIQMPDITGLEFIKALEKCPYVVITTAYKKYALEGFELNVVDYLLKPFAFPRFLQAVEKVLRLMENMNKQDHFSIEKKENDYLVVRADRKLYKINFSDLVYMEGQKSYVSFYTESSGRITALITMKELETMLPPGLFLRIHKSYIVSKSAIHSLDGNMLEVGDSRLPVGKSYKRAIEAVFQKE